VTEGQRNTLFKWQKTPDFARQVTQLDQKVGNHLLTEGRLKPLREALILRDFADTLGFSECRLCPAEFPDGELRDAGGTELQVEITEVQTPGRRRGDEYKAFSEGSESAMSHHEWAEVRETGSKWVDWMLEGIRKKVEKKYDKNVKFDIIVYNDISHLFGTPEISKLSEAVGQLLHNSGYLNHWIWQYRSTTIDLLWPRVLCLKIPGWESRF